MGFSLTEFFGGRRDDEDFEEYEQNESYDASSSAVTEEEAYTAPESRFGSKKSASTSRILNMSSTGNKLSVLIPTKYEDVMQEAVVDLKQNAIVILNLEKVDASARMRIVDFMAGVVAAFDGKMKKIASCSYAVAPKNVDWIHDLEDFEI
jgi:FtsZ-interacting cell division protein YlmF